MGHFIRNNCSCDLHKATMKKKRDGKRTSGHPPPPPCSYATSPVTRAPLAAYTGKHASFYSPPFTDLKMDKWTAAVSLGTALFSFLLYQPFTGVDNGEISTVPRPKGVPSPIQAALAKGYQAVIQ